MRCARPGVGARYLEGGIEAWRAAGRRAAPPSPPTRPTRWVTRERPKIDRIACPWLIQRFIDPEAEFLYVPTAEVRASRPARAAVPYDIPDVDFSHDGERCSFDAFLAAFRLTDPALAELALIVRGADTDRHDLAPQSRRARRRLAGPVAPVSPTITRCSRRAWCCTTRSTVWCKEGKSEVHTWNPTAYCGDAAPPTTSRACSFGEALRFWLKLGFISFGGPTGQIAIMHQELVERRRWISERPLPARAQLLHGAARSRGAAARDLHRLADAPRPGAASSPAACSCCPRCSSSSRCRGSISPSASVPLVAGLFYGIKPAVTAVVVAAAHAHRLARAEERLAVGHRRGGLRRDFRAASCRFPPSCSARASSATSADASRRSAFRAGGGACRGAAAATALR